jgi:hypothetical protein
LEQEKKDTVALEKRRKDEAREAERKARQVKLEKEAAKKAAARKLI